MMYLINMIAMSNIKIFMLPVQSKHITDIKKIKVQTL
jgi:hypothetical protein